MNYDLAWAVYGIASLVAILCWFGLTRPISNGIVRWILRMPIIALCFTPLHIDGGEGFWLAPAIAAVALDLVAKDIDLAIKHAMPLLIVLGISVVLGAVIGVLLGKQKQRNP